MGNPPNKPPQGGRTAPTASQGYVVVLEVEYDAKTEREARLRALRDAETLFQQYDVLSVTADGKKSADELFPLTKAYLESKAEPA
jgi:hypothetical protein